ncbi:MAG: response regulator, partial [Lachnospiraceae bacterium]|nr:response regulator [Lachnospiraceae bacterium]
MTNLLEWMKKHQIKLTQYTIAAISSVLCLLIYIYYDLITEAVSEFPQGISWVLSGIREIPIILMAGFFGNIPAMFVVLFLFAFKAMHNSYVAYMAFLYLILAVMSTFFSKHRFYKTWKHTIYAIILFILAGGVAWGILLEFASGVMWYQLSAQRLLFYALNAAPGYIIAAAVIHLIMENVPDEYKARLLMGKWYIASYDEAEDMDGSVRSVLSAKITAIIVLETVVLAIFAAVSANILVPTLAGTGFGARYATQRDWSQINSTIDLEKTILKEEQQRSIGVFFSSNNTLAYDIKMIMLILSAMVPMAVFTNFIAQRWVTRPIVSLTRMMRRIRTGSEVELSGQIRRLNAMDLRTGDEVEELYQAILDLGNSVYDYIGYLQENRKLEDDLHLARKASEAKSNFLSNMSHEIRTPINVILGMDEIILRDSHETETLHYAQDIRNAGQVLLGIVNDILDFSKIEAGKLNILPVEYDIASMLVDLRNMIQIQAARKYLKFEFVLNREVPHFLYGDEIRIKQCILNLLTNAVKYTEEGQITFLLDYEKLSGEEILLKIAVKDTGSGIREEEIAKITSPFERADEKKNRDIEGTGLGMSIVQSLLEMMDSKLELTSEYGVGSTFGFNIVQKVRSWEPLGSHTEDEYTKDNGKVPAYHEKFQAPQAEILVVDDMDTNLSVFQGLLKSTKIKIDTAQSGPQMLQMVTRKHYDLIFLDHRMPEMDGVEALARMREMAANRCYNTPCIALTANAISGAREFYLENGFAGYMSKPVDGSKLEELLAAYLPEEKLLYPGDDGFEEISEEEKETAAGASLESGRKIMRLFFDRYGIDIDYAMDV